MHLKDAIGFKTPLKNELKQEAQFSPALSLHKRQSLSIRSHDHPADKPLNDAEIKSTLPIAVSEELHSPPPSSSILVLKRRISTVSEEHAAEANVEAAQALLLHASEGRRSSTASHDSTDSCNEVYEAPSPVFSSSSWTQYAMDTGPDESSSNANDVMQWDYTEVPTPGIPNAMPLENVESLFLSPQDYGSTDHNESTDYDAIKQWINDLTSDAETSDSQSFTSLQSAYDQPVAKYYHVELIMQPTKTGDQRSEVQSNSGGEDNEWNTHDENQIHEKMMIDLIPADNQYERTDSPVSVNEPQRSSDLARLSSAEVDAEEAMTLESLNQPQQASDVASMGSTEVDAEEVMTLQLFNQPQHPSDVTGMGSTEVDAEGTMTLESLNEEERDAMQSPVCPIYQAQQLNIHLHWL